MRRPSSGDTAPEASGKPNAGPPRKHDRTGQASGHIAEMSQLGKAKLGGMSRQAGIVQVWRDAVHGEGRRSRLPEWPAAAPTESGWSRRRQPASVHSGDAEHRRRRNYWSEPLVRLARPGHFWCGTETPDTRPGATQPRRNPASRLAWHDAGHPERVLETTARTGWIRFAVRDSRCSLILPGNESETKKKLHKPLLRGNRSAAFVNSGRARLAIACICARPASE